MITVERLTKRFPGRPAPALEDASLDVRNGEILGLVGLNGAGKTTTIRIAAGVTLPTGGRVLVDGLDVVREKRRASAQLGWVPELFPYHPPDRALPLLEYLAELSGSSRPAAHAIGRELLASVGLETVERDRISTYSQGMKKRLSLAAAMIGDPPNLVLDEVLNGLDPEGIAFVRRWTAERRRQGRAILLSSHQLAELEAIADRVTFLHHGRVLRTVERAELAAAGDVVLRVSIPNLDAAGLEYLRSVGSVVAEGTVVRVTRPTADSAAINAELVRRGYRVTELRVESTSLEAYFLGLIGANS